MKKPNSTWGLSDAELTATIESMPDGIALFDGDGDLLWANRRGRRLLALLASTTPGSAAGTPLALLVARLIGELPLRGEEYARWLVDDGGVVEVALKRAWGSHIGVRLSSSFDVARTELEGATATPDGPLQIIVIERLLDEADVGVAVADGSGRIRWMNQQAQRVFGSIRRLRHDAERDIGRAARHVAAGQLAAPIRMRLQLPTRAVEAKFWSAAPGLAGVLFVDDDVEWLGQLAPSHWSMRAARSP